ncbi:hypothetical protein DV738_g4622, partial [Chaetothyriales sp. CBS 135597]
MPPKGSSTAINPVRLQSVKKLKVQRPDRTNVNPCMGPMSAVLTASGAQGASSAAASALSCAALEQALRECMDFNRKTPEQKSTINYHLQRLYPNIRGKTRRKGSLG